MPFLIKGSSADSEGAVPEQGPPRPREGLACSGSVAVVLLSSSCSRGTVPAWSELSQQFSVFPEGRAKPGQQLVKDCAITQMWYLIRSVEVGGFELNPLSSSALTQAVHGSSPLS